MLSRFSSLTAIPLRHWLVLVLAVLLALDFGFYAGRRTGCQLSASMLDISAPINKDYKEAWAAQPNLMAKATAALNPKRKDRGQTFFVSVAAGGSQAVFGREAEAVRDMFARRLGKDGSGLMLSNADAHLSTIPMASRVNLAASLAEIGKRYDPARDTAVIYLTAHGAPQAWLQTDLPNAFGLESIDAAFLAQSLNKAGITRRVVIISACFSGTWIPALASPDTIVITASSATRTSFGCDDRRKYTFFGEALLNGPLSGGASWREVYDRIQSDISAEESQMRLEPSVPMNSVGARMAAAWNAPLGSPATR